MPPSGLGSNQTSIELQNGTKLSADVIVPAVGQTPNTQFLSGIDASSEDSLINPNNRFIRVKPTLQLADPKYPNIFAVGDVADSGAHKAARPGGAQAAVLARNLVAMIEGKEPTEHIVVSPPAIHLSLGLVSTDPYLLQNSQLTSHVDQESDIQKPRSRRRPDGADDQAQRRVSRPFMWSSTYANII